MLAHGCGDAGTAGTELATRSTSNDDGAISACESDLDCPAGEECEFEHGDSFCKPHGGDGGNGDEDDYRDDGVAGECESDLDCPAGEECEFEHGDSFCKPHGGDGGNGDEDDYGDDRSGSNSGKG